MKRSHTHNHNESMGLADELHQRAAARFFAKVQKTETCWIWTSTKSHGYGALTIEKKPVYAHRFSYQHFKGPIPKGREIDHLCRNRLCVNPDHLEAVTKKENILRGIGLSAKNAIKTHCKRGHEFTPENTYINQKLGTRCCRHCQRDYQRHLRAKTEK